MWSTSTLQASQAVAPYVDELTNSMAAGVVGGFCLGVLGSSLKKGSRSGGGISLSVTLPSPLSLASLRKAAALAAVLASLAAFGVVTGKRDVSAQLESAVGPAVGAHARSASSAISGLDGAPSLALAVACVVVAALASCEVGACVAFGWPALGGSGGARPTGTRGSDTPPQSSLSGGGVVSTFASEDSVPLEYTRMKKAMKKSSGDKHGAKVVMYEAMLDVFDVLVDDAVQSLKTRHELPKPAVEWLDRMMRYTVPGGKLNRGLAVVHSAATLSKVGGRRAAVVESRLWVGDGLGIPWDLI